MGIGGAAASSADASRVLPSGYRMSFGGLVKCATVVASPDPLPEFPPLPASPPLFPEVPPPAEVPPEFTPELEGAESGSAPPAGPIRAPPESGSLRAPPAGFDPAGVGYCVVSYHRRPSANERGRRSPLCAAAAPATATRNGSDDANRPEDGSFAPPPAGPGPGP